MINNNYAVIMAGGIGSRFWPVSTSKMPNVRIAPEISCEILGF